jgi:hypothetical protein
MDSANSFRNHLVPPSRLNSFHSLKVARTAMVLPLLVISVLGRGIEARLCSVIQTTQLGFVLVYNTTICVTLQFSTNTLKGFNMEIDIELYDLELEINTWVEWEDDPDYSPNEGLYDKFIWVVYLQVGNTRIDITDELSAKECKQIEKQIEESLDDSL